MQKIIITGGAGFIGSHIVDALVEEGYDVHIIDNLISGNKEHVNEKATLHIVDIRDREALMPLFKDVDYVFHKAALPQVQYSIENPLETNDVNVGGLLNVLEASRLNKVKKVIFASSSAVYGDPEVLPTVETMEAKPLSPYGAHKYIGEVYCKLYSQIYDLETVCFRYVNVYGRRQSAKGAYASVIPKFIEFKKNREPLIITGDGEQTRDFIYVRDVVRANILAMKSDKVWKGDIMNIGSGKDYSVNYIAKLIGGPVTYIEKRVEPRHSLADTSKAKNLLGWQAEVSLEEGVGELNNL